MGIFRKQFEDVVEWKEFSEDQLFWKWPHNEIKKGSKLIIKPGQDAIFLKDGVIEGVFKDEGKYDIDSEIIPVLSTLKGFKYAFDTGMRAEVLFINTKEFIIKWGTQNPVNIPSDKVPGGIPVRANGTCNLKVDDYTALIDNIAGVKDTYTSDDLRLRITAVLSQLLMKHITKEGKDMFNLQASADEIGKGIADDLDMTLSKDGIKVTRFNVMSFSYPEEIQKMVTRAAAQSMVGDTSKYTNLTMVDAMADGKMNGGSTASGMAEMMVGMQVANNMLNNMNASNNASAANVGQAQNLSGAYPKFCPNCGKPVNGSKFCPECGAKLA
ncbi:MAG: SPFH domain-containing protein [Lachnospiraceae bacterium]|nr:SPFH domain-containing protein [Lachnospiraceae bacterium]MEE3461892.1 SPFH domain-containing protein [Lachnospiraceae bacterium]